LVEDDEGTEALIMILDAFVGIIGVVGGTGSEGDDLGGQLLREGYSEGFTEHGREVAFLVLDGAEADEGIGTLADAPMIIVEVVIELGIGSCGRSWQIGDAIRMGLVGNIGGIFGCIILRPADYRAAETDYYGE